MDKLYLTAANLASTASNWDTPSTGVGEGNVNLTDPGALAGLIVDVLTWAIGVAAVIFIIVGGIKYATSGGDEKKVASAKNTILYAVIGLVVGLLANVIIRVVLNAIGVRDSVFGVIALPIF